MMISMLYVGAALLPILILCIALVLKGTAVKLTKDNVAIGFCRYSVMEHTFSAKKIWVRPVRRSWRPQCMVQVAVFQNKSPVRTHLVKVPNEKDADLLVAKIERCCNVQ